MNEPAQHAFLESASGAPRPVLERLRIRARATPPLLDVTAEQFYANTSPETVEIVYTFPLPPRATLLGLEFELGDRKLIGQVKAKRAADADYDDAVEQGNTAVLVEQQRDGIYSANLGNLLPGERATIRLRYGQFLDTQGEGWRVAIPTVLAPFYGDAELDAGISARQTPRHSLVADYPLECTLELVGALNAGSLHCTSHAAAITALNGTTVARLDAGATLDRDIVFLFDREQRTGAIVGSDGDRAVVMATTVIGAAQVEPSPASVRLVLDCSGSMAGDSMDWAAVGCQRLVERLRDDDEFSITRFGSNVDAWMRRPVKATAKNRLQYARKLLNVVADLGGTEMEQALRAAAQPKGSQSRSEIVLLTDGEIWASDALVRWARSAGLRIFVIGVGSSPNQPFLTRLAADTGGTCDFVTPGEDMLAAVQRIVERLQAPRREAIAVTWPTVPDWTLQVPAVAHAGQTVHLMAGFEAAPMGLATIEGIDVTLPGALVEGDALARLTAHQRLLSGHFAEPALAAEQYQLVTEWTSLVAVLERAAGERATDIPALRPVEHMVPAGWGGSGRIRRASQRLASLSSAFSAVPMSADRMLETRALRMELPSDVAAFDGGDSAVWRSRETDRVDTRQRSIRRHKDELSRWVRAINRRVLIESLSLTAPRPTIAWLSPCVSASVSKSLEREALFGLDEHALVMAFIAALSDLSGWLDEALSERTHAWLGAGSTGLTEEREAARAAAERVLDDFLAGTREATEISTARAGVDA